MFSESYKRNRESQDKTQELKVKFYKPEARMLSHLRVVGYDVLFDRHVYTHYYQPR